MAGLSVHPRVCGERATATVLVKLSFGSSPRMRGTPPRAMGTRRRVRFIPAYAGNASRSASGVSPSPVHPRVCGERDRHEIWGMPNAGSSPRMRGTHRPPDPDGTGRRFIPAYAGNARELALLESPVPVHPRVCGERGCLKKQKEKQSGSSPRMRGTPTVNGKLDYRVRFIPAYAGNARTDSRDRRSDTVHPRVCGERIFATLTTYLQSGSSPRMRGTRANASCGNGDIRFIPAYAGNAATRAP